MNGPAKNTDRELYREDTGDPAGSYYENSVHVTENGAIGMNVGGTVIIQPIAAWHEQAHRATTAPQAAALPAPKPYGVRMGTGCQAHRHRELVPLEVHHIWPRGEGGPDQAWNRITLCDNAHGSVHSLLDLMLKHNGAVAWTVRRQYGRKIRELAAKGYDAITTKRRSGT